MKLNGIINFCLLFVLFYILTNHLSIAAVVFHGGGGGWLK